MFFDEALQVEFDRKGYVIIDLMSQKEFEDLLQVYEDIQGVKGTINANRNSYELSFFEKDVEIKKKKFAAIKQFFMPKLTKYLDSFSPIIINLFNKEGGAGEVPVHQNWTFVDEQKYTSISVWCPLQNVNRENGTLEVVPGTHKVIADYRGPSIPWVFDEINEVMIQKYMVPLNLHVGQVAVIDDSVIHYSGPNQSQDDRKAVQLIMKPDEAQLIHCLKNDEQMDRIDILAVDDDFFFDFDMTKKPEGGKRIQTIHFPIHKISEQELLERSNRNLIPQ